MAFKKNGQDDYEDDPVADEFHVMRLEPRPFRPFKTSEEYLYAMKEDLAEWLNTLYGVDINVDNFLERLETGVHLCQHANNILRLAKELKAAGNSTFPAVSIPEREVVFRGDVLPGTFKARDNISNFISWCRALAIKECLLFETDDLVMRKNERSFILCLLEVARVGARYGMPAPVLVQMEQEIDAEIEDSNEQEQDPDYINHDMTTSVMTRSFQTQEQRMLQLLGLHERVVNLLNRCTCPSQFPMIKVADGKYRIGDTRVLIFVRILRNHVMVRVGGGWDTLEHYLDKHDPCRCRSGHRFSTSAKLSLSSGKGGSQNMQVTYNRASQNDSPQYRGSPKLSTQYTTENSEYNGDYPLHLGRKSHDFSSIPSSNQPINKPFKPRSRSFDASNNLVGGPQEDTNYKRFQTPKGLKKENSDPSSFIDKPTSPPETNSTNRNKTTPTITTTHQRKSPLLPSCPNKIPLQKSASKSKIPYLDQPIKSPKSQSTEDLFRSKYYLCPDDRWMRSRSSSSSPVHGTPRSTSMEQCNLSSLTTGLPKMQYRRSSGDASNFNRNQPGQYSFRKKSPELRRKNDLGNKTWSFHHSNNRSPLYQEWVSPVSQKSTSPLARNGSATTHSSSSPKQPRLRKATSPPGTKDIDDTKSSDILKNLEILIDQLEDRKQTDCAQECPRVKPEGTKMEGHTYAAKNRLNNPAGSRIPVLQWK